jgi:hypothetical protein
MLLIRLIFCNMKRSGYPRKASVSIFYHSSIVFPLTLYLIPDLPQSHLYYMLRKIRQLFLNFSININLPYFIELKPDETK